MTEFYEFLFVQMSVACRGRTRPENGVRRTLLDFTGFGPPLLHGSRS